MQITSGSVQSQSQHFFEHDEQRVSLRLQDANSTNAPPAATTPDLPKMKTVVDLKAPDFNSDDPAKLYGGRIGLLKLLVEAFTGHSIDTIDPSNLRATGSTDSATPTAPAQPATPAAPAATPVQNVARVARVDATHVEESELTEVAFKGRFNTSDGQMISVDLHYKLQRDYSATTVNVATGAAAMRDPLILNFNGQGVQLGPQRTSRFDLDSDGSAEAIPALADGSAYLALDMDGNGTIDRGSELFGPSTNNGFAELAKYDEDGNGFIDSGDSIFDKLRLFRPGENLQTLADRDVGAIFLGATASPARLTDSNNQSLGQLRATSFYLTNKGGAGFVQELDLSA